MYLRFSESQRQLQESRKQTQPAAERPRYFRAWVYLLYCWSRHYANLCTCAGPTLRARDSEVCRTRTTVSLAIAMCKSETEDITPSYSTAEYMHESACLSSLAWKRLHAIAKTRYAGHAHDAPQMEDFAGHYAMKRLWRWSTQSTKTTVSRIKANCKYLIISLPDVKRFCQRPATCTYAAALVVHAIRQVWRAPRSRYSSSYKSCSGVHFPGTAAFSSRISICLGMTSSLADGLARITRFMSTLNASSRRIRSDGKRCQFNQEYEYKNLIVLEYCTGKRNST